MGHSRPDGFSRVESNVRFQMRPVTPPPRGHWLGYRLAIAALIEFGGLVSEWGAIELPTFLIMSGVEDKAVLQVDFINSTD